MLHDKVECSRQDQDDDHNGCLGRTRNIVLRVSNQKEQADEGNLQYVDAGKQLRKSIVEKQSMRIDFVPLNVVIVVPVSYPEQRERQGYENKHQRRYNTVYQAWKAN